MKAFPKTGDMCEAGMDLRDYFAAQAITSLIPQYRSMYLEGTLSDWEDDAIPCLTEEAYYLADWMMKARDMKHGKITAECYKKWKEENDR